METVKAHESRKAEGFFEKYLTGKGLDIGAGPDPVTPDCDTYDLYQSAKFSGDATTLEQLSDASYDWVHSSHCLEHLDSPAEALKNWWRVLRPGGHLVILVPHRDLYEKRQAPPSRWNLEHKTFWLPEVGDGNDAYGLRDFCTANLPDAVVELLRVRDEGCTNRDKPNEHAVGEFSIEIVLKKLK